jgi:hypothetical protein
VVQRKLFVVSVAEQLLLELSVVAQLRFALLPMVELQQLFVVERMFVFVDIQSSYLQKIGVLTIPT